MKTCCKFWYFALLSLVISFRAFGGGVIISEVMYHPASENLLESYVELYNSGTNVVSLSGWSFTKGINYTFPVNTPVNLQPGAYLVVASDAPAFTSAYPGVTNFIAGWPGAMKTHLKLVDSAGQTVNEVNFSNDGDWAARVLTTNYNSFGHYGWEWTAAHDGGGSSLELLNSDLPNSYGQNWTSSTVHGGTPGGHNSTASTNIAPIITSVAHSPLIPGPSDPVTISARLIDERTSGLKLTLYYRNASTSTPGIFSAVTMLDDGTHGDGTAGDGIFGAILQPNPAGTIMEFYLVAQDADGHSRTHPNVVPPTNSTRTANLLYQVDSGSYTGAQPLYRIIMTEMELNELYQIGLGCPSMDSDAEMNATWITTDPAIGSGSGTEVRYNIGVRNRGHGTRSSDPNNYHINIPGDRSWKNLTGLNINSQFAYSQVLGSAIFRRLELPMAESRPIQFRVNSTNLMVLPYIDGRPIDTNSFGSYAANEQYNNDFIARTFALDPYGNSYRGIRDQTLCDSTRNSVADLSWHGFNYAQASYTNAYFKQNNLLENDWSDLIDLIAILNSQNGYQPANYVQDVERRINIEEWMQYMAVNTLLDNGETCLANGVGDDYALYRGTNDTRFLALSYDMDTVMGRGLTPAPPHHSIWLMTNLPVMDKFMKTAAFAPIYFKWLKAYADSAFAPSQMNPLLDQLFTGYLPQQSIDNMKAFNAAQVSWVLSQFPLALTISNNLSQVSGYPHTTTSTVTLFGTANSISTRSVLVNGAPTSWTAWTGCWTNTSVQLYPGINHLLVQALDANGQECQRSYTDIWYDDGSIATVGGIIAADQTWTAAGGPYNVTSTLTVPTNVTLTIQPGTTLYLGAGVNIVINNGGRLLAEGTSNAPIRFTVPPGSGVSWGGMTVNGAGASPETRIAYAWFEANGNTAIEAAGGTLSLDHTSFLTTTHQYVSLDGASFLISGCYFPTTSAPFELLHGTGGIKAGGRGIVRECFFGSTTGYNDIMDFTGGNRDLGQPIIQYLSNVFVGASDDMLDLDGTDAWIEGNIFLHSHRNGSPDSSSAISGGNYDFGTSGGVRTSEITIIGNLFFDCDNAATAKEGNFFTFFNNTIVHTTKTGGEDFASGVVNVRDTTPSLTAIGLGFYLEGNVIWDAEQLVRNYDSTQTTVTFNNNIIPMPWSGPGSNNVIVSPLLSHIPQVSETYFTNWESAQVMRTWFALLPGSPALGTGPNGSNKGGVIPIGLSLNGPNGTNSQTTATLTVGIVRSGYGIPIAGFPNGSGYVDYKYRLDGGSWSAETPTRTPISLTGLAKGPHQVDVIGKRDSGWYQDDPAFGAEAVVTSSPTWVVDTSYVPPNIPTVRLNEILAQNSTTLTNGGVTPDLIELYNYGSVPVNLSGMGLTDAATKPYKYTFPSGTPLLNPGQYLVLYADSQTTAPGIHLGFSVKASGDDVYLHQSIALGGALLDSVVFGVQVPDFSIGRELDGTWVLCQPSFGSNNVPLQLGDQHHLKINEWLTDELFVDNNDFVELFNPDLSPVALGGCFLSNAEGAPALSSIPALSFIAPTGFTSFTADGTPSQGANHVNFKLDPNCGIVILSDPALNIIDEVTYGPQTTDVSQGRSPSGSDNIVSFLSPTPGGPNPAPNGVITVTNIVATLVNLADMNTSWRYDNSGGTNYGGGSAWYQPVYSPESTWSTGQGLFGYETTAAEYLPYVFRTYIPPPNTNGGKITVYYRSHFTWNGVLTNYSLVSTNFVDDGAVYYLNGAKLGPVSSIRMPATYTYNTTASGQIAVEGTPEYLYFTNQLLAGDNVLAVEVHQINTTSSDDVFGMLLNAVQYTTNIITTTTGSPIVLNEVLASNRSLTNADGSTSDWIELLNATASDASLTDISLSDDPNAPRKFVFPTGAVLPANSSLVVYCNNSLPPSTNNTGFSLKASGGAVYLFNGSTAVPSLVDSVVYGVQIPNFSIGRVPNGTGGWTLNVATPNALNSAAGLGTAASLKLNEWLAASPNGGDWFELFNAGADPVSIGGLTLTDDLTQKTKSPIPALSFIGFGPDGFVQFIADNNTSAGANHVSFAISASGSSLGLFSAAGQTIDAVTFGSQQPNISQGRFPDGSTNIVSFNSTQSPAESNYLPLPAIVVNELLSHTDPPLEDAVEFYNGSPTAIPIGGWFLSNSKLDLKKYRIPDAIAVPAQGYSVLYEYQFNPTNGGSVPFTFNSAHGDRVYLSQADATGVLTGYRAPAMFGAAANGVSFGRYTNSVGEVGFIALSARSFGVDNPLTLDQFRTGTGAPNASPQVGPVVINEIMFQPPLLGLEDDVEDEYIELHNLTSTNVPLFDPQATTNTWQITGGVDFSFPGGVTLPAGGYLIVVSFDPAVDVSTLTAFRSHYSLKPLVQIFGPYSGHLSNSGETIELDRPDAPQAPPHPDVGFVPYLVTDYITYVNGAPWPAGAGGTGLALERSAPGQYGNDPANWFVGPPTPGRDNSSNTGDSNGDGLPDSWQIQYFGSIDSPQAAPGADPDGDGVNNLQEYLAGTDPTNPQSYFKIDAVVIYQGRTVIRFNAVSGKTYTLLFGTAPVGTWTRLADVPAQLSSGVVTVTDPSPTSTARFYRLVTPALP